RCPPPFSILFPYTTLFRSSFGSLPERLVVPFEAVKAFYDPSAQFGLQFGKPGAANDLARQHMATAMPDLVADADEAAHQRPTQTDRKSTRLNSSHQIISYA